MAASDDLGRFGLPSVVTGVVELRRPVPDPFLDAAARCFARCGVCPPESDLRSSLAELAVPAPAPAA